MVFNFLQTVVELWTLFISWSRFVTVNDVVFNVGVIVGVGIDVGSSFIDTNLCLAFNVIKLYFLVSEATSNKLECFSQTFFH